MPEEMLDRPATYQDFCELKKSVDHLEEILLGNGQFGIIGRVRVMWAVWTWAIPVSTAMIGTVGGVVIAQVYF